MTIITYTHQTKGFMSVWCQGDNVFGKTYGNTPEIAEEKALSEAKEKGVIWEYEPYIHRQLHHVENK